MISRIDSHCTLEEVPPPQARPSGAAGFAGIGTALLPGQKGAGQGLPLAPGLALYPPKHSAGQRQVPLQRAFLTFFVRVQGLFSCLEFS